MRLWRFLTLAAFAVFALAAGSAKAEEFSGVWRGDDGGLYYLSQLGGEIWWYGESDASNPSWANVAHGRLDGERLVSADGQREMLAQIGGAAGVARSLLRVRAEVTPAPARHGGEVSRAPARLGAEVGRAPARHGRAEFPP